MGRLSLALLLFTLTIPQTAFADIFTHTPIKHATFVLQSDRTTIYIDPAGDAVVSDIDAFERLVTDSKISWLEWCCR